MLFPSQQLVRTSHSLFHRWPQNHASNYIGRIDFYSPKDVHLAEDYLRFSVCKPYDIMDLAKERLRGLKKYIDA